MEMTIIKINIFLWRIHKAERKRDDRRSINDWMKKKNKYYQFFMLNQLLTLEFCYLFIMKMKKKKRKLPGGNVLILQEITEEAN